MLPALALLSGIGGLAYVVGKAMRANRCFGIGKAKGKETLLDILTGAPSLLETQQEVSAIPDALPSIFGSVRRQQLTEFSDQSAESALAQAINRDLALSSASLGVAIAGTFVFPPLCFFSILGLTIVYLPWFKDGYRSLVQERKVNMSVVDAVLAFLLLATGKLLAGAAMATCVSLGKKLLIQAEDHSHKKLINVFDKQPRRIWVLKENVEIEIPFEHLNPGDRLMVHAGESIPVDGVIIEGQASVDQRILTGEAQPVEKGSGDQVFALTVVLAGQICIQANQAGKDTVAAQIGKILNQSVDTKMALQWQWMERMDAYALPILATTMAAMPLLGTVGAVGLMFPLSGPYSMRVGAPMSLLTYLNLASAYGILIKDGRALELLREVDTIVFDKTGTLTEEIPTVGKIYTLDNYSEDEILTYAAAAEYKQTHPVAKAIQAKATVAGLTLPKIADAHYEVGYGLKVRLEDRLICVGSLRFMKLEGVLLPAEVNEIEEYGHEHGYSLLYVAVNGALEGVIELRPTIRPEAQQIISGFHKRNLSTVIISGDHEKPTAKLAAALGVGRYFAETLPEQKAALIEKLQTDGKIVCFIGDGINDSLALKQADLSISLRGAASIATDAAQIVLMDGSLIKLEKLFEIGHEFDANLKQSLLITLMPNAAAIGGLLFFHIGIFVPLFLYYLGMGMGVANAMLPMVRETQRKRITDNASLNP